VLGVGVDVDVVVVDDVDGDGDVDTTFLTSILVSMATTLSSNRIPRSCCCAASRDAAHSIVES
jgi:hypothetical protein